MTSPRVRTSRKILVASLGVATMSYVISCGSTSSNVGDGGVDGRADAVDEFPIANLVARPDAPTDTSTTDEFPVANLVARPDTGLTDGATTTDATIPDGGGSDSTFIDEFPVANLVAFPD